MEEKNFHSVVIWIPNEVHTKLERASFKARISIERYVIDAVEWRLAHSFDY